MMGTFRIIICDLEGREIDPKVIFGNRVNHIGKAMERIRKYGLGDESRYEGCYKVPDEIHQRYEECCIDGDLSFDEWLEIHYPDERELERISCLSQDQKIKKKFKFIYGTARKNGYFLVWQGKANGKGGNPDCWTVKQKSRIVGNLQLISS